MQKIVDDCLELATKTMDIKKFKCKTIV